MTDTADDGDELERYLARYGEALGAMDATATAALWGEPSMMLTDEFAGMLETREQLAAALATAQPEYRAQGLARATHTLVERAELSPRLLRAHVRWHFWKADGEHIADADFEYLLRRDDDGLHAYAATLRGDPS
ncbi:hypothetical protein [Agrococcus sp. HG114]|uniref:hypothetical protein n=1 Tax=Agrococcus sp. HG114 TaxID=2969757 RepID=UPI00215B15A4|nr:hypothetical protein [Agrococcus sp. HG114]MCR8671002.1 hypothetical protein [Agrococcus sp. HG114]